MADFSKEKWVAEPRFEARPPSANLWEAIGYMVGEAGRVETLLRMLFISLLGDTAGAYVLAQGQNSKWLVDNCRGILGAMRELSSPVMSSAIDALDIRLRDLLPALQSRNDLVHAQYASVSGDLFRLKSAYRKPESRHRVSIEEVDQLQRDLLVHGAHITNARNALEAPS